MVQLGGQRFNPEDNLEEQVQLINTSFFSKGKYNFTIGTDNTLTISTPIFQMNRTDVLFSTA
jgi:hypothetical protein